MREYIIGMARTKEARRYLPDRELLSFCHLFHLYNNQTLLLALQATYPSALELCLQVSKGQENWQIARDLLCRGKPPSIVHRVDVIGISCYSSKDLLNWHHEGQYPTSPLHYGACY
jgi:hypothetical protein